MTGMNIVSAAGAMAGAMIVAIAAITMASAALIAVPNGAIIIGSASAADPARQAPYSSEAPRSSSIAGRFVSGPNGGAVRTERHRLQQGSGDGVRLIFARRPATVVSAEGLLSPISSGASL
jgi:hypothetical protein